MASGKLTFDMNKTFKTWVCRGFIKFLCRSSVRHFQQGILSFCYGRKLEEKTKTAGQIDG